VDAELAGDGAQGRVGVGFGADGVEQFAGGVLAAFLGQVRDGSGTDGLVGDWLRGTPDADAGLDQQRGEDSGQDLDGAVGDGGQPCRADGSQVAADRGAEVLA
jgi:hypothetical protein